MNWMERVIERMNNWQRLELLCGCIAVIVSCFSGGWSHLFDTAAHCTVSIIVIICLGGVIYFFQRDYNEQKAKLQKATR